MVHQEQLRVMGQLLEHQRRYNRIEGERFMLLCKRDGLVSEMMMLGEKIGAEKAESWGLIYKAVDDAALQDEAMALATRLAAGPTVALGVMRQNIAKALEADYASALLVERRIVCPEHVERFGDGGGHDDIALGFESELWEKPSEPEWRDAHPASWTRLPAGAQIDRLYIGEFHTAKARRHHSRRRGALHRQSERVL